MPHRVFIIDQYEIPLPAGHKFPGKKYGLLRHRIEDDLRFDLQRAPLADLEAVQLAHDPEYVRQFANGSLPASSIRRIGFPWSEMLVKRSLASVGGTIGAASESLANGWGATLGGGTHHALRGEGAGFCAFNDIAVAIQLLRSRGLVQRAAVVDLDVHQGDGTAEIFQNDAAVFTVSIHCRSNFPFRKQTSSIDVHLPDKTGDEEYLRHVADVLPEVIAFRPDIVFYQSGVDGLACDSLGHLSLTHAGLLERDRMVMESARNHRIPFVLTMGGGYAQPIEESVQAHANTYQCAAQVFSS